MAQLGEPFVFGLDHPRSFLAGIGYEVVSDEQSSGDPDTGKNPIFALYRFYGLRRMAGLRLMAAG